MTTEDQTRRNLPVTISRANPTEEELGAVLAVIAAVTRPQAPQRDTDDRPIAGGWKSYWRTLRRPRMTGREAWRYTYR